MYLPGVSEKPCHNTPAFYVEKKLFARIKEDGQTLALYNNDRDEWIARNGDIFFFTDHYKNYPMLLVDIGSVETKDLISLLAESWKCRCSKKMRDELERGRKNL